MSYKNIKVGADPELFLKVKGGEFVPACGLIGGSKDKPKKIDKVGHAVQEDNVMVEYNIRPAKTVEEFLESHKFVLNYLRQMLPEYELAVAASVEFRKDQLQHPQAKVFGRDPDYNAWTLEVNPPPTAKSNLRTAGGHIHVGYDNPSIQDQVALAKAMDLFIGVPSILLDADDRRRSRYGKAGAFRPKDYGIESRTPSNFWIANDKLQAWAFNNTRAACAFLNDGGLKAIERDAAEIQNIINNGDKAKAQVYCDRLQLLNGV